jgi:isopentenyldiphosphate isomerase
MIENEKNKYQADEDLSDQAFNARQKSRIMDLAERVKQADHLLSLDVYRLLRSWFVQSINRPAFLESLRSQAPEYDHFEYLVCVDRTGQPFEIPPSLLEDVQQTIQGYPEFKKWFQVVPQPAKQTLLVGRWLCHLLGFRHKTIHLFIDHPNLSGFTLVQVRGACKAEAPGRFDLPVAGHIDGLLSEQEALYKEMFEELSLRPEDLLELELLTRYSEENEGGSGSSFRNAEHHVIYRCRVSEKAIARLKPGAGEVAAIACFSIDELAALMRKFPDHFASGIKNSFKYYQEKI